MIGIMHVEASPRGPRSISSMLADEFTNLYLKAHPGLSSAKLSLWKLSLPEFDETAMNAKFKTAGGEKLSEEETKTWNQLKNVFERFNAADRYVFSVPMWNFGIPYKLKHFIDVVTQPGLSFTYEQGKGFKGLLTGRKAVIVASRGGDYSSMPGDPLDFQVKYVRIFLNFIGISDVSVIMAEGLNIGKRDAALTAARAKMKETLCYF